MSTSKPRRRSSTQVADTAPASDRGSAPPPGLYALPATVSRPALIEQGSDKRFRGLVHDLLTIAARMEIVRAHFGGRIGITGPQYTVLIAIAHLQGESGVSVGALARALHVSSAFIAVETGKLARAGLVLKRPDARDRRSVLLSVGPVGRLKLDRVSPEIRATNDLFFGALDENSFHALCSAAAELVEGSREAMRHLCGRGEEPAAADCDQS